MKLISTVLLASALTVFAATEEKLNKTFAVPAGGTVIVDVDFGSIILATNATAGVTVDVLRKITRESKAEEEEFLRQSPVTFSTSGTTLTIRSRNKKADRQTAKGRNENSAKYTVHVPAQFNARLKTAGGHISASDVTGEVEADTSGGGLEFARLRGPLNGDTSGGGIKVADCEGVLKIETSGGGIRVAGGSGSLDGDTSGGGVEVKDFRGPIKVRSSGGGLNIQNVSGKVDGSTSGGSISLVLPKSFSDAVALSTSGGGITAQIPDSAGFNLDAQTSSGSVSSEISIDTGGKNNPSRLAGTANGGGPTVRLHSSGGGIQVKKL